MLHKNIISDPVFEYRWLGGRCFWPCCLLWCWPRSQAGRPRTTTPASPCRSAQATRTASQVSTLTIDHMEQSLFFHGGSWFLQLDTGVLSKLQPSSVGVIRQPLPDRYSHYSIDHMEGASFHRGGWRSLPTNYNGNITTTALPCSDAPSTRSASMV